MSRRRLWKIFGGLRLRGHKALSMSQHVQPAPVPDILILPLQQHIGHAAEAIVEVGDTVLKGQMIAAAKDYVSTPIHAPTSGKIIAIEDRPVPHPSGMSASCIVLKSDGKDNWCECNANINYRQLDPSALRNIIRDAGIVGLGGAGFPSFIKLNPGPGNKIETLILNGAECEPYITCDAMLMQEQGRKIIDGLNIMRHALNAEHCIIAIEDNKKVAHTMLVNALHEHEAEYIDIVQVPTLYPAGGEKQLIKTVTGKEVPSHGLPVNIGIVCHNVATAAAIATAVLEGKPLISRYVTITGEGVEHPCNLDVLFGTPFSELIDLCSRNTKAKQVLMGGPMMGFEINNENVPVIKTTNCILVQDTKTQHQVMPCIRCGQCASVCPAQLLPQQLYWYARAGNFDKAQDYNLFDCIECGCCAYVCPSHIPLVQFYRYAKTEVWAQEREKKASDIARQRHEFRLHRIERKKAENEARKKKKRELLKKAQGTDDAKDAAEESKKAAIQEAMERVKARRATKSEEPANTQNLTEEQKKAIAEIEARRNKLKEES